MLRKTALASLGLLTLGISACAYPVAPPPPVAYAAPAPAYYAPGYYAAPAYPAYGYYAGPSVALNFGGGYRRGWR